MGWALILTYLLLLAETFYIQKVMHDSAVYKHGAWHVLIGGVCLNPCVFGWWMPVSVLWAVARVKRQLEALELKLQAEGRSRSAVGSEVEPRLAGASWGVSSKAAIVGAIVALLVLFLLWHFANMQKAPQRKVVAPAQAMRRLALLPAFCRPPSRFAPSGPLSA